MGVKAAKRNSSTSGKKETGSGTCWLVWTHYQFVIPVLETWFFSHQTNTSQRCSNPKVTLFKYPYPQHDIWYHSYVHMSYMDSFAISQKMAHVPSASNIQDCVQSHSIQPKARAATFPNSGPYGRGTRLNMLSCGMRFQDSNSMVSASLCATPFLQEKKRY